MSVQMLVVLCIALLLVAAGLWLWQSAAARSRRQAASAFVEEQLNRSYDASSVVATAQQLYPPVRPRGVGGRMQNLMLRAGVEPGPAFYGPWLAALVLLPLLVLWLGGGLGAMVMLGMVVLAAWFQLWWRAERRKQRMVRQLPGFIDALVRLITIGNSLGSAFHTAVGSVDEPLFEVLERANQLNRAGMELDASLVHAARLYRFYELELVAAVIGVALRFGGRSDLVLERMAAFMRDLQQAREELHALSAEVRLSAWILALLPVFVAGFIVVFNNAMFMGMWTDPVGQKMLIGAFALQLVGSFWLYRMAKSV
ncbi:MAG: type II secretion system F family protein [Pigmentiphaga sp.]|uniref:type II secretion system F family protein n=1 Tax=Pigmentiphaga sp. TaxID=1977564 RepID=UPI0029BC9FC5|nr:type II secretion system F family protein [Pigmentiphaga sp.]MDX3907741.1 type II secretion system F family protein [Pigmentiphaga sp.]